ncbi:hypothetical protein NW762_013708 [Fusarium torreyae]|uniref:SpvB-domain-containing protein n=1 Tax=Fusarium torreyae TaxID=1237075 RepID=A0A9W8V8L0_9HYPO|nr:hypothetical protein NW762_013708 [Fusarium torreyae]
MFAASTQKRPWEGGIPSAATQHKSSRGLDASSSGQKLSSITTSKHSSTGRGGGAVQDLKQKLQVNPNSGTLDFSIPIPSSPGRAGIEPSLMLNYSSGYGNGIFGLGWKLNLRSITRRTSKNIPKYNSEDIFLLDGVDELVPLLVDDKTAEPTENNSYIIEQFVPRMVQDNKRIERWTSTSDQNKVHWRVISASNVTTVYGSDDESRVFEEKDTSRRNTFSWLPTIIYDALGNAMEFTYKPENASGMSSMPQHLRQSEQHRDNHVKCRARYLKSIRYGNRVPNRDPQDWDIIVPVKSKDWMFELLLDYGEHDLEMPTSKEETEWGLRMDPFSSYTSGFEVRHYRLCRRILMFHHIPEELGPDDYLVSSAALQYAENAKFALLASLTISGHIDGGKGTFSKEDLAPWEFSYTTNPSISDLPVQAVENFNILAFPGGRYPLNAEWVDLDGDGAPGLLVEDSSRTLYYQRNNSNIKSGAGFAQAYVLPGQPIHPSSERYFEDINRNGKMNLVFTTDGGAPLGYYERSDQGWENFEYFGSTINTGVTERERVRLDLVGDGLQDIMIVDEEKGELKWHRSLAEKGFGHVTSTPKADKGFHITNLDQQVVTLYADMSGDGLVDVVHIRSAKISYWPNIGYGRFGQEVTMGNCPIIGEQGYVDPSRIRLADVDATGTQDLLYFPPGGGARLYYNLSGNSWSDAVWITQFPALDSLSTVSLVDLFGNGTSCLCWIGPDSLGQSAQTMLYLDLTRGHKPYVLNRFSNGLGHVSSIEYLSSTAFFRKDEAEGRPWRTRLPTPIHCVESTKQEDLVTGTCFTTRFRYHDGVYDGEDHEFAGFAAVEQWDAEVFNDSQVAFTRPPIHKLSWFHSGRPDFTFPSSNQGSKVTLTPFEPPCGITSTEASRALRGMLVREEIYCDDNSPLQHLPYTTITLTYEVGIVQPKGPNGYCSTRAIGKEKLSFSYERQTSNPRYSYDVVLETNKFGQALKSMSVAYGLKNSTLSKSFEKSAQEEDIVILTENTYTNCINGSGAYREPDTASVRKWRLVHFKADTRDSGKLLSNVKEALGTWTEFDINSTITPQTQGKVLLQERRTYYIRDDLTDFLELGKIQDFSITSRSYELASLGPLQWIHDLKKLSDNETWRDVSLGLVKLPNDDSLWRPESYHLCSDSEEVDLMDVRMSFYSPARAIDPLDHKTEFTYDDKFLFPTEVLDAVGNKTTTSYSYRALKASQVRDPNGNCTGYIYDAFCNLTGVAQMGKAGEEVGDSLVSAQQTIAPDVLERFIQNPALEAMTILGDLTERLVKDHTRFNRSLSSGEGGQPCYEALIKRQEHVYSGRSSDALSISISFLDSQGEVAQQAELADTNQEPTWCIRGRSLKDNKGEIVREYRPILSPTHAFRSHLSPHSKAITHLLDPLGRRVATLNPDHTWSKTIISPWCKVDFDQGDIVLIDDPALDEDVGYLFQLIPRDLYFPTWYNLQRASPSITVSSEASASASFHNTPTVCWFDALGREISTMSDERGLGYTTSRTYSYHGHENAHYDTHNRLVQTLSQDLLQMYQVTSTMESGATHKVFDSLGREVVRWTDSAVITKRTYDPIGRLKELKVASSSELPVVAEIYLYGEDQPQPELKNMRGNLFEVRDQSGVSKNLEFDFKNNCIAKSRQLAVNYKERLDWSDHVELEDETPFISFLTYNVANQVVCATSPNGDITRTSYNSWGLPCRSTWQSTSEADMKVLVDKVEYNEDRKPTVVQRGNKCMSRYFYDDNTGRLREKITVRADKTKLQHKVFVRDCFGRETHVTDLTQDMFFFRNSQINPVSRYRFDSLGRLVSATGVEQVNVHSQTGKCAAQARVPTSYTTLHSPSNGQEVAEYCETYLYDLAGNMKKLSHQFSRGSGIKGWTRSFSYNEASLLREGELSNRLSESTVGDSVETYRYFEQDSGALGCLDAMPGFPTLSWDFSNRLKSSSTQYQSKGTPEKTFHVYDSQGNRVRKVTERSSAINKNRTRLKETLYIDNFTIYREFKGDGQTMSLEKKASKVETVKGTITIENCNLGKRPVSDLIRYQIDHGLEIDTESRLVLHEMYSPFGMTTYAAVRGDIKAPAVYRYSAYERDEETSLYYTANRYYAPWLGRWLSPDPKGIEDGLNRYVYVSNDPISFIDPQGTDKTRNTEGSSGENGGQPTKTWTDTARDYLPTPTTALKTVTGIALLSSMRLINKNITELGKTEAKKMVKETLLSVKEATLPVETFARNIPYHMKLAYGGSHDPSEKGKVIVNKDKLGFGLSAVNWVAGQAIDKAGDKALESYAGMDPVTASYLAGKNLYGLYNEGTSAVKNVLNPGGDEKNKSNEGGEKGEGSQERLSATDYVKWGLGAAIATYKWGNDVKEAAETLKDNIGPALSMIYDAATLPNKEEPSRHLA